jgi:DNA-nicking Smr family endonuclease
VKRPGRGLSPDEAELWSRVARTVRPLHPSREGQVAKVAEAKAPPPPPRPMAKRIAERPVAPVAPAPSPPPVRPLDRHGLDAGWDRRLGKGTVAPDFTLDLHGCTLDAAHARLDHGLTQALAHGARVVLVITGRPRPADAAGRGERRGAIRAKFMDWMAAGPHASRIAAIRAAHPRHGGAGAVYVVLKRAR